MMGRLSDRLNGGRSASSSTAMGDEAAKISTRATGVDTLVTTEVIAQSINGALESDSGIGDTLNKLYATAQQRIDRVSASITEFAAAATVTEEASDNWSEHLRGVVTLMRTYLGQVPSIISRRVNDIVTDAAVAAQLNLASSILILTDDIRESSDTIAAMARELDTVSATWLI
eukprot:COSAG05_NODE_3552_length_1994_cov_1.664380_2_plen_173_part_00